MWKRLHKQIQQEDVIPPEATCYHQVGRYKQALIDSFRTWSLSSATPLIRRVRILLAGILFAGSLFLLIAADVRNDPAADFYRSSPFVLLIVAGFCFFYAFGMLLLGFLRGLAVPLIAALTAYSLYTVVALQSTLSGRSLVLRLSLVLLAVILYGLIVYFSISGFRKRHDLFNWIYRREHQIVGVDIALKDLLPIAGYTDRITAVVHIGAVDDEEKSQSQVIRFSEWYHHRLAARLMLPCGFVFDTVTGNLTLYAYSKSDITVKRVDWISRLLTRRGINVQVDRQPDEEWQAYLEALYPDPVILNDIINELQIQMLEDQGVDLQDLHLIRLDLRFPDEDRQRTALEQLTAAGYKVYRDPMPDDMAEDEMEAQGDWNMVVVELTTRLGLERLNTITRGMISLIQPLEGELLGWEQISLESDDDGLYSDFDQDEDIRPDAGDDNSDR